MMGTKKELLDVAEQSIALNKEQQEQIRKLQADVDFWQELATSATKNVIKLQAEVERLRHVLNEEADYCQSFADLFSNQDRERAARHQARADRLRNSAKEQAND